MAQQPAGYNGQGLSLRGEKDRYVLPPSFRKAIAEESDDRILCVSTHDRWPCLTGFGRGRKDSFYDQLDKEQEAAIRSGEPFDREERMMQLFSYTEIPYDSSGRFVLPDHLADLAGLDGTIYFQGVGLFITLWNPDRLYEMGSGWRIAQSTCRTMLAEAEAKRK